MAARRPAEAVEVGRKLAAAAPRDPRGPYLMALGLGAQGKRAEARQQLEASLTLAPQAFEPLAQLVALTLAERQPAQALERVKKQIALVPTSAPHHALLGETTGRRRHQGGRGRFQQAITLDPISRPLMISSGSIPLPAVRRPPQCQREAGATRRRGASDAGRRHLL